MSKLQKIQLKSQHWNAKKLVLNINKKTDFVGRLHLETHSFESLARELKSGR